MDIQALDFPVVPLTRRKQLESLHKIADYSRLGRKPFWLAGGWAVETLTGEQNPRLHGDIDLLIFRADYSAYHFWLARHRYVFLGEQYHGFSTIKHTGGAPVLLSFIFLDWEDGRLVTYLPDATVNWPCEDPYKMPADRLGGKLLPVCDWEMAYAYSELLKHVDPEQRESPDKDIFAEQVKAARRKAISKSLIVSCEPG